MLKFARFRSKTYLWHSFQLIFWTIGFIFTNYDRFVHPIFKTQYSWPFWTTNGQWKVPDSAPELLCQSFILKLSWDYDDKWYKYAYFQNRSSKSKFLSSSGPVSGTIFARFWSRITLQNEIQKFNKHMKFLYNFITKFRRKFQNFISESCFGPETGTWTCPIPVQNLNETQIWFPHRKNVFKIISLYPNFEEYSEISFRNPIWTLNGHFEVPDSGPEPQRHLKF